MNFKNDDCVNSRVSKDADPDIKDGLFKVYQWAKHNPSWSLTATKYQICEQVKLHLDNPIKLYFHRIGHTLFAPDGLSGKLAIEYSKLLQDINHLYKFATTFEGKNFRIYEATLYSLERFIHFCKNKPQSDATVILLHEDKMFGKHRSFWVEKTRGKRSVKKPVLNNKSHGGYFQFPNLCEFCLNFTEHALYILEASRADTYRDGQDICFELIAGGASIRAQGYSLRFCKNHSDQDHNSYKVGLKNSVAYQTMREFLSQTRIYKTGRGGGIPLISFALSFPIVHILAKSRSKPYMLNEIASIFNHDNEVESLPITEYENLYKRVFDFLEKKDPELAFITSSFMNPNIPEWEIEYFTIKKGLLPALIYPYHSLEMLEDNVINKGLLPALIYPKNALDKLNNSMSLNHYLPYVIITKNFNHAVSAGLEHYSLEFNKNPKPI